MGISKSRSLGNLPFNLRAKVGLIINPSWYKQILFVRCCGDYRSTCPEKHIPEKCHGENMSWRCKEYFETVYSCAPTKTLKNEVGKFPLKLKLEDISKVLPSHKLEEKSQNKGSSMNKKSWPSENNSDAEEREGWQTSHNYEYVVSNYLSDPIFMKRSSFPKESTFPIMSSTEKKSQHSVRRSPATATDVMEYEMEDDRSPYIEESIDELEIDCNEIFEVDAVKTRNTKQDATIFAMKVLSKRVYTVVELKKELQKQKFPSRIIEEILAEFRSSGWLNDSLYADAYSLSKFSSSSWGPKRIERALLKKGVTTTQTKEASKRVFEGDDFDGNCLGMNEDAMDQLYAKTEKQWLRYQKDPLEKRKQKIIRWLQYREYKWDVINVILKKLQSSPSAQ